jgi:hypothetical protein
MDKINFKKVLFQVLSILNFIAIMIDLMETSTIDMGFVACGLALSALIGIEDLKDNLG